MIKKDNIILSIIFFIGFALRAFYSLYMYKNDIVLGFADDYHYLEYGKQVLSQGIFAIDISMLYEPEVAPFLPWLLAIKLYIFGENWLYIFIFNSFLCALFPIALFVGLKQYFSKSNLYIVCLIIAINPMFIYLTPSAGKETLLYFFNLALVISFLKCLVPKNIILNRILFSLVFSLSLYADERYLIFIPFFFFYYIFYKQKEKYIVTTIFIFLSVIILVQTPWTYRNYLVYDRIVLISERTDHFTNLFRAKDSKPVLRASLDKNYLSKKDMELIIKGELIHYQSGKGINKNALDFIKAGNKPYKFNFLEKAWVNFKSFWKVIDLKNEFVSDGFKFHGKWNLKHNLSSIFFYGFLLPFFIYSGFKNLNKTHINIPFLFTIYASLIHTFIVPFSSDRYRTPYDFFIILISIHFISTLYKDKHLYLRNFKAKVFEKVQKL